MNYPKVMVVSVDAWNDHSGVSTLLNVFKRWEADQLLQIYTRNDLPNTKKCNLFFRINELSFPKRVFNKRFKTGDTLTPERIKALQSSSSNKVQVEEGREAVQFAQTHRSWIYHLAHELLWVPGGYRTKEFKKFLKDNPVDILFLPTYPSIYMTRLQLYVMKHLKHKKVVTFTSDDNYTFKSVKKTPYAQSHRAILRHYIRKIMDRCDLSFVMTDKMREEYDPIFGTKSLLLTKAVDFSGDLPLVKQPSIPIKIVYTGKWAYGRFSSLALLAQKIKEINGEGNPRIQLFIYSNDVVTEEVKTKLDIPGSSFLMGGVPFEEALRVQREADILLFAESLEDKFKYVARLSFSTKLVDYMKAGKCILAIGAKDIAPIEYFTKHQSALVASDGEEITQILQSIIKEPNLIKDYSVRAFKCGQENHDEEKVQNMFVSQMLKLVE